MINGKLDLDAPPPSRVRAATIHMQSTAKGERSCRASKVSLPESNTGLQKERYEFRKSMEQTDLTHKKVEQP